MTDNDIKFKLVTSDYKQWYVCLYLVLVGKIKPDGPTVYLVAGQSACLLAEHIRGLGLFAHITEKEEEKEEEEAEEDEEEEEEKRQALSSSIMWSLATTKC